MEGQPPLGFQVVRIAEAINARFVAALAEVGVTPRELRILVLVYARPGISQRALAEGVGVDPGNLVAVLDVMSDRGWLARAPAPLDRRRHTVALSRSGRELRRRAVAATEQVEREVFGALPPHERESFAAYARQVWDHLGS